MQPKNLLAHGLTQLKLNLTEHQQEQLLAYLNLLVRWNAAYNLTAIRDPNSMVVKHLLDSLAVAPYVQVTDLLDVGTGAGLPGIPLAIAYPELKCTLLDSNSKKIRFLRQVKIELGLSQLEIVHERLENYHPQQLHHQIISRAYAAFPQLLALSKPVLQKEGRVLAMMGQAESEQNCPVGFVLEKNISLAVPGIENEQRHLWVFMQGEAI